MSRAHYNLATTLQDQGSSTKPSPAIASLGGKARLCRGVQQPRQCPGKPGQAPRSRRLLRPAIELRPDWAAIPYNLGNAFRAIGRLADAVACYRQAIERKPDYAEAYNNLGNAFQDQAKITTRLPATAAHWSCGPTTPRRTTTWATPSDSAEIRRAVACYRRALELKPTVPRRIAPPLRAQLLSRLRRRDDLARAPAVEPAVGRALAGAVQPHGNDRSADGV